MLKPLKAVSRRQVLCSCDKDMAVVSLAERGREGTEGKGREGGLKGREIKEKGIGVKNERKGKKERRGGKGMLEVLREGKVTGRGGGRG